MRFIAVFEHFGMLQSDFLRPGRWVTASLANKLPIPRRHQVQTNHRRRKPVATFCLALLMESVAMQLVTTAGDSQVMAPPAAHTAATSQVAPDAATGQVQPTESHPTDPTQPEPQPTTIFPQIAQPVLAAAPVQPLTQPNPIFRYPLSGYVLTQHFSAYHQAVDLAAPHGTPVVSTAEGVVTNTGYLVQGGGLMVSVDHGNGMSSIYAHLSSITVQPGQRVGHATMIGRVGSTGWSTGPHLHFMLTRENRAINPLSVLQ